MSRRAAGAPTVRSTSAESIPQRDRTVRAGLLACALLGVGTASSFNVAQPHVFAALNPTPRQQIWLVDSFTLGVVGGLTVVGLALTLWETRPVVTAGLLAYTLSALWAALSSTTAMLIGARACMGLATGAIVTAALAGLARSPTVRHGVASWAVCVGAGGIVGRVAAGVLLNSFWYGSVFVAAAFVAVVLVGASSLLPRTMPAGDTSMPVGVAAVRTLGIVALAIAVVQSPTHGWMEVRQIGLVASALLVGSWLAVAHRRVWLDEPADAAATLAAAVALGTTSFVLFGLYFVLTQFWQSVQAYGTTAAALLQLPIAASMALTATLMTKLTPRRQCWPHAIASAALMGLGFVVIVGADASSTYWRLLTGMVLVGTAAGVLIPFATMELLPLTRSGLGERASHIDLIREFGGALGIAVVGGGVAARYRHNLRGVASAFPPALQRRVANSLPGALAAVGRSVPFASQHRYDIVLRRAYVGGLHALASAGAFVSICTSVLLLVAWLATRTRLRPIRCRSFIRSSLSTASNSEKSRTTARPKL